MVMSHTLALASSNQGNAPAGHTGKVAAMRSKVASCSRQNSDHTMLSATSARPP